MFGVPGLRLGPHGRLIRLPEKLLLLVALLILEFRNEAPRQTLAARVWEAGSKGQANANLRQVLAKARLLERKHGIRLLDVTDTTISRDGSCVLTDLETFLAASSASTEASLGAVLELYRGDMLDGMQEASTDLAAVLEYHRRQIRDRFVDMVVSGAEVVGGRAGQQLLQGLQMRLPNDDRVCRAVMRAAANLQGATQARQTYLSFAHRMQSELGIEPEDATKALLGELWHTRTPATASGAGSHSRIAQGPTDEAIVPRFALLLPDYDTPKIPRHAVDLARELVEAVALSMCRFRSLAVIAPYSAAQFKSRDPIQSVTEFGVDYVGITRLKPMGLFETDALALEIALVATSGRRIIWVEEFKFDDQAGAATHRAASIRIARMLVEAVEFREVGLARACDHPTAFGHFLMGKHGLRRLDLPNVRRARKALRAALDLAPNFALAHGWLARTHVFEWVLLARSDAASLDEAERHATKAIELDGLDGIGYGELGRVELFRGRLDEGLHQLQLAIDHAPQHADFLADRADALVHASEIEQADAHMRRAMSLNPLPPDEYLWTAGAIGFFSGRYAEGLRSLESMKTPEPANRLMAACAAMCGDQAKAKRYRQLTLSAHPDFTVGEWLKVMPQRDRVHRDQYSEGLRRAGFD